MRDHIGWLRWTEAEELKSITDADMDRVVDGVTADEWMINLFDNVFGVRVPSGDRIGDAAEWVRNDFSYMNSWWEGTKEWYRRFRYDER